MVLGIDYGRAKVGLALADSMLAEPYLVVRVKTQREAVVVVEKIIKEKNIEKIVLGISEGEMGREQEEFAEMLRTDLSIPVTLWDETLSTQDAQAYAIESGVRRRKRREMEDAYAAALMLQSYLDSAPNT